MISFVPGALSGMGWLRSKNVHAQHACDHNRFSSIPATEEKKKKGTGQRGEKKKENRNIYIQFALQNISECEACACLRVRLHV